MQILRHENDYVIQSDLDPIEDILNLITTLKSIGFTSDLLKETHGFTNSAEIKKTSKLISLHVENAISLACQGFDGPPQTSFLSLYYSTLNLAKVYILLKGKRIELENNRWHGAKYSEIEMKKQFLNEKITISKNGTIPLFYKCLTNDTITSKVEIKLDDIYRNISTISAEYSTITKKRMSLLIHQANVIQDDINGHSLNIRVLNSDSFTTPPNPRHLRAYPNIKLIIDDEGFHYETNKILGNFDIISNQLKSDISRNLVSDNYMNNPFGNNWYSLTPISNNRYVFTEELDIMLAYFHLSNVVRYNPEHLYKLMDSKYWAILLGLRKHGYLRFEKLIWGHVIKKSFAIN